MNKKLKLDLDFSNLNCICVTGKMASGKNFICYKLMQRLRNDGWTCVDADSLVHKAIDTDEAITAILDVFNKIAKEQKLSLQYQNGKINRKMLGKLIFSNPKFVKMQEDIVYPIVTRMAEEFIQKNPKTIINATLLYKTPQLLQKCQAVIYIKSTIIKQIYRAQKRDNLEINQIINRLKNQKSLLQNYKDNMTNEQKLIIIKN